MSSFDTQVAADNPQFLNELGDVVTYRAAGNPANDRSISVIKIEEKPHLVAASSADEEFYECSVLVSNRNNTEGVTAPVILGFLGATNSDQILNLFSLTWYVIDCQADADPSFNELTLRTKAFPKTYEFGG